MARKIGEFETEYSYSLQEWEKECFSCTKAECDNCLGARSKTTVALYEWKGKKYTTTQLAEIRGMNRSTLYSRIRRGCIEFAMSEAKSYKKWLREKK